MYEEVLQEEYEQALSIPLTSVNVGKSKVILFRADMLPAGVKHSIGRCLLAHYLESGRIDNFTRAVVVHGAGNTVKAVKHAAEEFALNLRVVAVVYAETSKRIKDELFANGIQVVAETPRREGRVGRLTTAEQICQRGAGYVFLEQHEEPLIIDIQNRTFGRAINERLKNPPTHFVAGVGTGGTVFGIGSALRNANPSIKAIAVEGVGSTLTLWHAYLHTKGKGYETEKAAIKSALLRYEDVGMMVSFRDYPHRTSPEEWFEIDIDFPSTWTGVVGIEGLGVGNPTNLILDHLLEVDEVQIVTDEEARAGVQCLKLHNIHVIESAGANFFAALGIAKSFQGYEDNARIITVVTAGR